MRRYRALIRAPHGPRLVAGTAVFYPGQAALGLVTLLALHRATGSFASAGAAGAAETIAFSLSSLVQARWIDRCGTRVIVAVTVAFAVAIAAIGLALTAGAPAAALVALAAVLGAFIPATGVSMRTVWSSLLDDPDQRATAFAYQSLAQDAGYVIGPAALGAVATAASPVLALACCCALVCAGALMTASVRARPGAAAATEGRPRSLVLSLASPAAVLAAVGVALGTIDVSTAAFATEHHGQQLAGVLLGAYSVGSIAGGAAYGARAWRSGLRARLRGCTAALGLLALAPAAAPGIVLGAPALALAGIPLSAALTTAYLLAAECAPSGRQTEAYAILALTLNGGAALGGALGGTLVSGGSARPGFLLAVASGLVAAAILAIPAVAGKVVRAGAEQPSP